VGVVCKAYFNSEITKKIIMRKILAVLALSLCSIMGMAQAQPDTNASYLPESGDIAFGFDASPLFNFVGNMFNNTSNNRLRLDDNTLYFRYYLNSDAAIRAAVRVHSGKEVDEYYVRDDAAFFADPLSQKQVIDRYTEYSTDYEIKIGYQMFHNKNRLRGFYGCELMYAYSKNRREYEYGNQMTELNPSPSTHWGNQDVRSLEINDGVMHGVGVGAFGGVEYYFYPKACIGAEFGINYMGQWEGESYKTQEKMVISQLVEEEIPNSPGAHSWSIDSSLPNYYGNVYFVFHF